MKGLLKRKKPGMLSNWSAKWYSIKGDYLSIYQKDDEGRLLETVPLIGKTVKAIPFNPDEPEKYLFEIKPLIAHSERNNNHSEGTGADTMVFWAETQELRNQWIQAVREACFADKIVFGQPLSVGVKRQRNANKVPKVVQTCIDFIKQHGMDAEGIFRQSGRTRIVNKLRDLFDEGCIPKLTPESADVHSVASLLKLYLRELPEPLIPFELYDIFLHDVSVLARKEPEFDGLRAKAEQDLISNINEKTPEPNYDLLKCLCYFLNEIARADNRMDASNLALVFCPNILRSPAETPMEGVGNELADSQLSQALCVKLILDCHTIFARHLKPTTNNDNVNEIDPSDNNTQRLTGPPLPPRKIKNPQENATSIPFADETPRASLESGNSEYDDAATTISPFLTESIPSLSSDPLETVTFPDLAQSEISIDDVRSFCDQVKQTVTSYQKQVEKRDAYLRGQIDSLRYQLDLNSEAHRKNCDALRHELSMESNRTDEAVQRVHELQTKLQMLAMSGVTI